ncbi:DUF3021 family protein [Saccharibacillus sp. CPCC 101409]|uniref:DUF3021 family protein n=1 Tax=Saccharibacillus sp. CPCC 101409 TaxID=3058041 RepID=UPI002672D686|nr:DUF3021 family protein [Saccharibacillus sp. CPCC 101409]MDO3409283.1 DUF3021 family protein [Saccharibacillus sp. CPCC 101409]
MEFKTFFTTQIIPSFFVAVACIAGVMGIVGVYAQPDASLGYGILFSPLIYGLLGALLQTVHYSSKELSPRQTILRQLVHLLLLEIGIVSLVYAGGELTGVGVALALALSIAAVYFAVMLILWINDKRTSRIFNRALQELHHKHLPEEK